MVHRFVRMWSHPDTNGSLIIKIILVSSQAQSRIHFRCWLKHKIKQAITTMTPSYQNLPSHPPHQYEPIPDHRIRGFNRDIRLCSFLLFVVVATAVVAVVLLYPVINDDDVSGRKPLSPLLQKPLLLMGTTTYDDNSTTAAGITAHQHAALVELHESITGRVIFRDETDVDAFVAVSRVWVRRVARQPYALILVASEADIGQSLTCFRRHNIPFRIRSGGHHKLGYSTSDNDGVVLDLQRLNQIEWVENNNNDDHADDDHRRLVLRLGPAVTSAELYEFLAPYNLSTVLGFCGSVAESGFALGGGWGIMSRAKGLGLDNIVDLRVVVLLAAHHDHDSGSTSVVNTADDADLDWAMRGAGNGNFGVVSSMTYQFHPISQLLTVLSVRIPSTVERAAFLHHVGVINPPGNLVFIHDEPDTVNMIWWGASDDEARDGEAYLNDLLLWVQGGGGTSSDTADDGTTANNVTHQVFHTTWDELYRPSSLTAAAWGTSVYAAACWTGFLLPGNNTRAVWNDILSIIDAHVDDLYLLPDIELWGGAISTIRNHHETAFPYRDAIYNVGVLLLVQEDNIDLYNQKVAAVDIWWPTVAKHLQGTYVNYPMRNASPRLMWGDHLPRLTTLKRRYDPEHLFRQPLGVPM
jgi:FAD/FMN-containing dehydrogenase